MTKIAGWAWYSIFNTDLSELRESDVCKRATLNERVVTLDAADQCRAIGGFTSAWCPSQGVATQITVYQYLVILKVREWMRKASCLKLKIDFRQNIFQNIYNLQLISWPILFALFARTAREVDEEADQIWKYQLYNLAVDFK